MPVLTVHHRTAYRYRKNITPGPHRLILRPRESRNLRLIEHDLTLEPAATVTWANDVFGNAVATATFQAPSKMLRIDSTAVLELDVEQAQLVLNLIFELDFEQAQLVLNSFFELDFEQAQLVLNSF